MLDLGGRPATGPTLARRVVCEPVWVWFAVAISRFQSFSVVFSRSEASLERRSLSFSVVLCCFLSFSVVLCRWSVVPCRYLSLECPSLALARGLRFEAGWQPLGGALGIVWGQLMALSICAGLLGRAMDIRVGQQTSVAILVVCYSSRDLSPSWLTHCVL